MSRDLAQLDRDSLVHPYTYLSTHLRTGPKIMTEANGVTIRDAEGREYIDSMAGLWCVNVGWGRSEIVEAISSQAAKMAYYHSFTSMANEPAIALAARLRELAPTNIARVFFGCTGSDANDTNVKLVWYYNNLRKRPDKKKIISRHRGYHGVTVASGSLSGLPSMHANFDLPLDRILHAETPHAYWGAPLGASELEYSQLLAERLDRLIVDEGPETVAAFIVEPVMGAGGVLVPPEGYFEAITPVLRRHDVLLIVDEVICGFGRLGRWFGSERFDLEPDLMTVAKGLSSGYVPISASLVSERMWEVLVRAESDGFFAHGFTYSAHPVCAAGALANLDVIARDGLIEHADTVGDRFQRRLRETFGDHPLVGEVRGLGLMAAVELVADRSARKPFDSDQKIGVRLARAALEEGLICRALPESSAISFAPPLVVTDSDCDEIIARFGRALGRIESELGKAA